MVRNVFLASTVLCALVFRASGAYALPPAQAALDDAELAGFEAGTKLDTDTLSGMRGGFKIGNLEFNFVITTKTFVDGVLYQSAIVQNLQGQITSDVKNSTDNLQQQITNQVNQNVQNTNNTEDSGQSAGGSNVPPVPSIVSPAGNGDNTVLLNIDSEQVEPLVIVDVPAPDLTGNSPEQVGESALGHAEDIAGGAIELASGIVSDNDNASGEEPPLVIVDLPNKNQDDNAQLQGGNAPAGQNVTSSALQNVNEVLPLLNTIVQSGNGNGVNVGAVTNNNTLLTVVQNSNDNAVIQQFNQLDVSVSNFNAMQQDIQILQHMNFEAVNALK